MKTIRLFCAKQYDRKRNKKLSIVWLLDLLALERDYCLECWIEYSIKNTKKMNRI